MTITRDDYIVCNDIFDNILNNPDDYSYDDLLNVAFYYKAIRKKLFDVLLIKCIKNNSFYTKSTIMIGFIFFFK